MSQTAPTTILMLSANPGSERWLDQEKRDIEEGLKLSQYRDSFRLVIQGAVRPRDLQRSMLDLSPEIVHFSGQGEAEAGLVFEDETGQPQLIETAALADLFALFAADLKCVVLNACYSEAQAEAIAQHIPYVIGMSQAIEPRAAIEFAVGFYDALGAGREIEFAYKFGCSAAQLSGLDQAAVPVLKKRSQLEATVKSKPVTIAPAKSSPANPAIYNLSTWVERSELTEPLLQVLQSPCRILALTGITGIGKTALAERIVAQLPVQSENQPRYCRLNLDEGSLTPAFSSSGAALLRSIGVEPTLEDQKDPQNLLAHLLQELRCHPYRIQIDSMERLLQGDDQEGWSQFCDDCWLELWQQLLTGADCQSQIILTTQELPAELEAIGSRYPQLWHCQTIRGLNEAEQLQLFQNHGIIHAANANATADNVNAAARNINAMTDNANATTDNVNATTDNANAAARNVNAAAQLINATSNNANAVGQPGIAKTNLEAETIFLLQRIGKLYAGHPLVLRVIAEDIKACGANVQRYWQQGKFAELEANRPAQLSRRKFQIEVKRRVKAALTQLPEDALQLLCRSAVYRRPVPESFWFAMLPDRSSDQLQAAMNLLQSRSLAEEEWEAGVWWGNDGALPLRQHNLIRGVAYELLKADDLVWRSAERLAAEMWLNQYEAVAEAEDLEKVRGYLEAFDHYCNLGDWERASEIYTYQIPSTKQAVHLQLFIWGQYRELIQISNQLLKGDVSQIKTRSLLINLGNACSCLGNQSDSIEHYQQALSISHKTGDLQGQSKALNNLSIAYRNLGDYHQSIKMLQQALSIACEIGDQQGEGTALGNLGLAYHSLSDYAEAIEFHQQHLAIAREIGDRDGEGSALGSLGLAYHSLGDYVEASEFHQQHLAIAREIGDRYGESSALGNLGIDYYKLGDYVEAIKYHQQALVIMREIGNRQGEGIILGNLGIAYCALGQYSEAVELQNQYLTIAHDLKSQDIEGYALSGLGEAFIKLEQHSDAEAVLQQGLEVCMKTGDRSLQATILKQFAELHHKTGAIELAQDEGERSLEIAREIGERETKAKALKGLAEIYQTSGAMERALECCEQALGLAIELGIPLVKECEELMEEINKQRG